MALAIESVLQVVPWSWFLIGAAVLGVLVTYQIGVMVYNLYFHPLAKFPGPALAAMTDWWLVYMIVYVPDFGSELHKKHGTSAFSATLSPITYWNTDPRATGSIVRLGPNLLSFSDATLLPHVYHRSADKPPFYESWMFGKTAAMFQSLKHRDHYAKKRLVAPLCSMASLKANHESKMSERIDELCEVIRERAAKTGDALDFSEYLRYFLSDVWSHLVYGQPKGWVKEGKDVGGLLEALQGVYPISGTAAVMPWTMPLLRNPFLRKHLWSRTQWGKYMDTLYAVSSSPVF